MSDVVLICSPPECKEEPGAQGFFYLRRIAVREEPRFQNGFVWPKEIESCF
jgi:hypothetical protein